MVSSSFRRSFSALLRRNLIYRRRRWISSLLEFVLPICSVALLVWIKSAVDGSEGFKPRIVPPYIPSDYDAIVPYSFHDYAAAIVSDKICVPNVGQGPSDTGQGRGSDTTTYTITGLSPYDSPVPFVKCDSRLCQYAGQDASLSGLCEYHLLALAPSSSGNNEDNDDYEVVAKKRVKRFSEYLSRVYPDLADPNAVKGWEYDGPVLRLFETASDIDEYVRSETYGTTPEPKIAVAIVLEGTPGGFGERYDYGYTLRMNSTNFNNPENEGRPATSTMPLTSRTFDSFAKNEWEACNLVGGTPYLGSRAYNSCAGQYIVNGAVPAQRLVDDWIMEETGATTTEEGGGGVEGGDGGSRYRVARNGVRFVPFPTKQYVEDGFFSAISSFVPLLIVLGMLYPVSASVRSIVLEKELRQKELMKMMSVSDLAIGLSWFVSLFSFFALSGLFAAFASSSLYSNSDFPLLLMFWELVMASSLTLALALASCFSKSTRATLFAVLLYFTGYFLTLAIDYKSDGLGTAFAVSIHPVTAFSFGLQVIGDLEENGVGLTMDTLGFSDHPSGYSFRNVLTSLLFDTVLWGVVSWYLNRVVRGDFGHPQPLHFPFTRAYWCSDRVGPPISPYDDDDGNGEGVESAGGGGGGGGGGGASRRVVPVEAASGALRSQPNNVVIRGLTKHYGEKAAVEGLNLTVYNGQITALLGHNGAGKTTTINMLTGMVPPTSGTATVSGMDVRTQMSTIRENIGICLQHDCLFPLLTVREHLVFFARIKGLYDELSKREAEEQIDAAVNDVALTEKRNTYSKDLSGGMKRKLSVAIAFCGGSKTVFLDEPTSGMDPFSRRFTWNVIRQYRQGRCIVLTTHFMDEADILGDRIAIMGEGQLRCAGSSLFLKREYGVGYQLTLEKRRPGGGGGAAKAVAPLTDGEIERRLTEVVTGAVSDASPLSNVGTEMTFQLPLDASGQFVGLFEKLDEMAESGEYIVTYGVSITTLDEVFLMVARGDTGHEPRMDLVRIGGGQPHADPNVDGGGNDDTFVADGDGGNGKTTMTKSFRSQTAALDRSSSSSVFSRHVRALFAKRAMNFKRDKRAWCFSTVCPSLAVLMGFLIVTLRSVNRNMDPLTLTLADYNVGIEDRTNPISYNMAGGKYSCQPGSCISGLTSYVSDFAEEKIFYCGVEGLVNDECSIDESDDLVGEVRDHGAFMVAQSVSDVRESSEALFNASSALNSPDRGFRASQYGAIYFTHDASSTVGFTSSSYGDDTVSACEKNHGAAYPDSSLSSKCESLRGIGYVVSTNFTALHASLLYQAIADEAIIRSALNSSKYRIRPSVHPLPITRTEEGFVEAEQSFTPWFLLVLSMPFVTGAFATFVVTERQSKAKHLQTVAGVNTTAYWFSTFLWDVLNYQLPLWIIVIMMFSFGVDSFTTTKQGVLGGTLVALILYGPAGAGFTYCFSFLFESPSLCNLAVIVLNFLIGMAGPLVTLILRVIAADPTWPPAQKFRNIASAIEWVLRFFPMYNMSKSLFYITNIASLSLIAGNPNQSVWTSDIMLIEAIYLAVQSVLYVLLAIQIDRLSTKPRAVQLWRNFVDVITCKGFIAALKNKGRRNGRNHQNENERIDSNPQDEDVVAEAERVVSGRADGELIVLKNLTKQYGNGKLAVDDLSFGIRPGVCFGLLGINGAGKTSTMAMLTAEFPPTSGDAKLSSHSVTHNPELTRRRIGYCPQFDAHFTNMTGREHVELYASIKGVPRELVKEAANAKLSEVGLSPLDSARLSAGYSGGMKRKLSVACATIGQPEIVFLDEPSTGMDPVARRDLWRVISKMVMGDAAGQDGLNKTSVILTTHSMEECEALCPLIGIMAGGKLRCLGSAQHLKSRFGQGFQVEMKCKDVTSEDSDYLSTLSTLLSEVQGSSPNVSERDIEDGNAVAEDKLIKLDDVLSLVRSLTGDDYISSMVTPENPNGYVIYKNASSDVGIRLDELAAFCVEELRVKAVIDFFEGTYSRAVLRERQGGKIRYEVDSEGLKISALFGTIEENRETLKLADYGVSQTSLEQVFNMHAAEAEKRKENTVD